MTGESDLKIFGSRVTKVMVGLLEPEFTARTGLRPVVIADVSKVMMWRIEDGEAFDLAVLVGSQLDRLIAAGRLDGASRTDLMRSGIGFAVRKGARRPDVSTVEAVKRTLLEAKSINYLKEGASTVHIERLIREWGLVEALEPKTVRTTGETVSESVAAGEVELGLIVIPNIMSVPGAEVAGAFPEEIQQWVDFAGAVAAGSRHRAAALDLLALLKTPKAADLMRSHGLEPM